MESKTLNLDLRNIPRILWYRKWTFLTLVVLITAASVIIASLLPNVYHASSTIILEQKPIAESSIGIKAITPNIQQRLRIFRTVLMSEYLLRKVIAHLKLVPNMYDPLAIREKINELRKGIKVRTRGTDSLGISYEGTDRQMVMRIANELTNFFIEDTLRYMQKVMKGTSAFLEEEMETTEKELKEQEQKMLAFKGEHLQELPGRIGANQAALDRLLGRLEGIDRSIRDLKGKHALIQKELAEFEGSFQHPLRTRLQELEAKLEMYQIRYTPEHPYLSLLVREIEELRPVMERMEAAAEASRDAEKLRPKEMLQHPTYRILNKQLKQYEREIEALNTDRADFVQKVAVYETRLDHAPKREQEWILLTRGYDVLKARYRSLMNKNLDAQLSLKLGELQKEGKFRVLDPARLPLIPVRPNRYLIVAVGCVAGLALGFGGVLLAEMTDRTVHSPTDLAVPLHLPLLASIPHFEKVPGQRALARLVGTSDVMIGSTPTRAGDSTDTDNGRHVDPTVIMVSDPSSPPAEQYRYLRTSIKLLTDDDGGKVLVVTSPLPREGKSVTVVNLAVALALEMDQNVLLIDGDLRTPQIHKLLDLRTGPGLADVLGQVCPLDLALQQGPVDGLMVLSAGETRANPADFITPRYMATLFSELRGRFRYTIVDSPPILPVADACLLTSSADGVIMVARAGVSHRGAFTDALQHLGNGKALGMVLNAVDRQHLSYRYDTYSGYGSYGQKRTED
ncbi:MAG: polysaccharide biosynthesis tyrosine autokinase [candidate division NC10 bacterium]